MSQTLIVYAHPSKNGHNGLILKEVQATLLAQKKNFWLIDLYAENFNPVLFEHNLKHPTPQAKKYQEHIKKSDHIIFIYPVWWGTFPAILKGFFDQVLTSGFAYKYIPLPFPVFGAKARPYGLLKGKQATVFITMGARKWQNKWFMRSISKRVVQRPILSFCGIRPRVFTLYDAIALGREKKLAVKRLVARAL